MKNGITIDCEAKLNIDRETAELCLKVVEFYVNTQNMNLVADRDEDDDRKIRFSFKERAETERIKEKIYEKNDKERSIQWGKLAIGHERLAEWLAELKFLRQWKSEVMEAFCKYDCSSIEEVAHNDYNRAIEDFANECLKHKSKDDYPVMCFDEFTIRKIAEKMKGGTNEQEDD